MATTVPYKTIALARYLKDAYSFRFSGIAQAGANLAVTTGVDTNGYPTILIGAGTSTTNSMFIRIINDASLQVDVLGLAQNVYSPVKFQIAIEEVAATGVHAVTYLDFFTALGELFQRGSKVELWIEATATAPSLTTFNTASKLKATFDAHYQYPLMATT
jgi:hypothetical protein